MKLNSTKLEKCFWLIEQYGPFVSGLFGAGAVIWLVLAYKISQTSFEKVLESTITLSSIVIGFVGVLLSILFTMKNTGAIKLLFATQKKIVLKRYFKFNIISGFLLVLLSLLLYLNDIIKNIYYLSFLYAFWGFLLMYTLASTYRIISILMHILFNNDDNETTELPGLELNEDKKESLKQQYKKSS